MPSKLGLFLLCKSGSSLFATGWSYSSERLFYIEGREFPFIFYLTKTTMSKIGMTMAKIETTMTKTEMTMTKIKMTMTKIEMTMTKIEMTMTKIETRSMGKYM